MPVVFIATRGIQYEKVISNIEEVRARGGKIIAVATEGDQGHPPLQRPRGVRARHARAAQPLLSVIRCS
jgi:glucosamine 6-phosphate synthetase-like amidotransferase/phosphosugar isomerase protein